MQLVYNAVSSLPAPIPWVYGWQRRLGLPAIASAAGALAVGGPVALFRGWRE